MLDYVPPVANSKCSQTKCSLSGPEPSGEGTHALSHRICLGPGSAQSSLGKIKIQEIIPSVSLRVIMMIFFFSINIHLGLTTIPTTSGQHASPLTR